MSSMDNSTLERKGTMKKEKSQFPELTITIRSDSHNNIYGLLPLVIKDILLSQGKDIGSNCGETYNFDWRFTNEYERKAV